MLSQDPGSETQFILIIFVIAVSLFGLILVGLLTTALPQIRNRGKPTQTSSAGLPAPTSEQTAPPEAASAAETAPETELTPPSPLSDRTESPVEHGRVLVEEAVFAAKSAPETEPAHHSAPADHTETTLEQTRETIDPEAWSTRQILRVALAGALMLAPALVVDLIFASAYILSGCSFPSALLQLASSASEQRSSRGARPSWLPSWQGRVSL